MSFSQPPFGPLCRPSHPSLPVPVSSSFFACQSIRPLPCSFALLRFYDTDILLLFYCYLLLPRLLTDPPLYRPRPTLLDTVHLVLLACLPARLLSMMLVRVLLYAILLYCYTILIYGYTIPLLPLLILHTAILLYSRYTANRACPFTAFSHPATASTYSVLQSYCYILLLYCYRISLQLYHPAILLPSCYTAIRDCSSTAFSLTTTAITQSVCNILLSFICYTAIPHPTLRIPSILLYCSPPAILI